MALIKPCREETAILEQLKTETELKKIDNYCN